MNETCSEILMHKYIVICHIFSAWNICSFFLLQLQIAFMMHVASVHFWRENSKLILPRFLSVSTVFRNYSKCRIWIFWILVFSANFCPSKSDLSGNTVWPQASGFPKLTKIDHIWHFWLTFVYSKCKRSSLRSQCWMRHFLWFLNTV